MTMAPAAEDRAALVSAASRLRTEVQRRIVGQERVLDEISFVAADRSGDTVVIDAKYVEAHIGDLARNTDLSRFIL